MVKPGILFGFSLLLLLGCSTATQPVLYQRLGADEGISAIVDGLLFEIEHDARIVHHFADTDISRFRAMLTEQLCELSGGPCRYSGSTMQESHTGFNITLADYDALVEGLIKVMQRQQISIADQNALLALLAPMYKDISYR
ncbi:MULTISPECIES: group I truncated hemoglobin [unclassified Arsukibacterium]|uniref:group I truncated hemoglobin n=1 Tax=unclassified Arsukibacterium TaxID=2635278 RepID=UPI000C3CBE8A|nr:MULTISPECIES: group 1 truncated hemoglobin [unclassified Arsukibacterium]MBM35524.1 group 1 truncated hemoglobin [Rheinheimera sp.]|tara:strand:+ start:94994 stop:95416 length:423 start_codon:yes stop_codon:yes gene_type:complete